MATLTITQNFGTSGLVSVHSMNKLIWTFQPTDDGAVITSKVLIGAVTFDGVQKSLNTATTPDTYTYELDVTEILKYFHNSFYHKDLVDEINAVLEQW